MGFKAPEYGNFGFSNLQSSMGFYISQQRRLRNSVLSISSRTLFHHLLNPRWMKITLNQQLHWTKTMPNHQLLNPRSMEKSPKSLLVHLHSKDHQRPCSHLLQQKYDNLYPQLMICRVSLQSMKYSLVLQLQLITHLLQAEYDPFGADGEQ